MILKTKKKGRRQKTDRDFHMLTNRKRTLHKNIYLHKWIKCGTVQIYVWINKHTSILCMWCVRMYVLVCLSIFIQLRRQNLLSNCELYAKKKLMRSVGRIGRIARGDFMTLVRLFLSFRKSHANDSQRQIASVLRMFESSLQIVTLSLFLSVLFI